MVSKRHSVKAARHGLDLARNIEVIGQGVVWLTCSFNFESRSMALPLEWLPGLVVPILIKRGEADDVIHFRIMLLSLPLKVHIRVLERSRSDGLTQNLGEISMAIPGHTSSLFV